MMAFTDARRSARPSSPLLGANAAGATPSRASSGRHTARRRSSGTSGMSRCSTARAHSTSSRSGWLQGPFQHGMTFAVQLQLAAPAKIDVASIENAQSAQQFMSALGGMEEAAAKADALWDELSGIVYGILMSPLNMIPGDRRPLDLLDPEGQPGTARRVRAPHRHHGLHLHRPRDRHGCRRGSAAPRRVDIDLQATADLTRRHRGPGQRPERKYRRHTCPSPHRALQSRVGAGVQNVQFTPVGQ